MNSIQQRLALALALFGSTISLPAAAAEQPPAFLIQWGTNGSGDGEFNGAFGVATDAVGNVYVSDPNNFRVQKFTGAGTYLSQWGSLGSGDGQFGGDGQYGGAYGVATDAAGHVYVADPNNSRIQKFTSTGAYLAQWGSPGTGDGQFAGPFAVATDAAGDVYVDRQPQPPHPEVQR